MSEHADVTVTDNADANRYDAVVDGTVAGFAEYLTRDGLVIFTHTEVDDAYEGQGVGSALARGALDDVRGKGVKVQPACEFMKGYIDRHEEYADLVS